MTSATVPWTCKGIYTLPIRETTVFRDSTPREIFIGFTAVTVRWPGQFNFPWGVKVDQKGFLYVADLVNSRIPKLNQLRAERDAKGSGRIYTVGTGDGDTAPDWTNPVINQATGIITLNVRAERAGGGPGRTYTIVVKATDDAGNSSTAEVQVVVPHDKGKK